MMWNSIYKPNQLVKVKHYSSVVEAKLIRKKSQPQGAWICQKHIGDTWTKSSIVNESYFK